MDRVSIAVGIIFALYIVYVIANRILIDDGVDDPINQLTGLERRDQSFLVTSGMMTWYAFVFLWRLDWSNFFTFSKERASARTLLLIWGLVFVNAAASSALSVIEDMSGRFLLPLYGWVLVVVLGQTAVLALVFRISRNALLPMLFLIASGFFAFFALNFSLADWFQRGTLPQTVLVFLATVIALAVLFGACFRRPQIAGKVTIILALASLSPFASAALQGFETTDHDAALERFRSVTLSATPDIHIVSIESMAAPEVTKAYLGIADVPYEAALSGEGMHRFTRAFATEAPTRHALNSVMRLAQADFPELGDYFAGRTESPLTALLHANGYQIANGFPITFMGVKGPFVDVYRPDPDWAVANSALCALAEASALEFFGFCTVAVLLDRAPLEIRWSEQVLEILDSYLKDETAPPTFTYNHILRLIGHTNSAFRSGNEEDLARFETRFLERATLARDLIYAVRNIAQRSARPALVIITGDHGSWLSRTVSFEEDPTFFVQDRHGIALTLARNTTGCSTDQLSHYMPHYETLERLLAGLFRCLAVDPARVDAAVNVFGAPYRFKDFRYD